MIVERSKPSRIEKLVDLPCSRSSKSSLAIRGDGSARLERACSSAARSALGLSIGKTSLRPSALNLGGNTAWYEGAERVGAILPSAQELRPATEIFRSSAGPCVLNHLGSKGIRARQVGRRMDLRQGSPPGLVFGVWTPLRRCRNDETTDDVTYGRHRWSRQGQQQIPVAYSKASGIG